MDWKVMKPKVESPFFGCEEIILAFLASTLLTDDTLRKALRPGAFDMLNYILGMYKFPLFRQAECSERCAAYILIIIFQRKLLLRKIEGAHKFMQSPWLWSRQMDPRLRTGNLICGRPLAFSLKASRDRFCRLSVSGMPNRRDSLEIFREALERSG